MERETDINFADAILGTTFGIAGNEFQFSDWGIPFISEITDLLVEAGYNKSRNYSPEMIAKSHGGHLMAVGIDNPNLITLVVFIGTSIGSWAIGKFGDLVLKAIKSKLSDKGYKGKFSIEIKYDDVSFAVNGPASSAEEANYLVSSVLKANQRILKEKRTNKTNDETFVYSIKDGSLPDEPTIIK